jgi:predicted aspartyl protease
MSIRSLRVGLLALAAFCVVVDGQAVQAETCQLKRVASLPMTIGQADEILVPGVFNDKKEGTVLIDTGAGTSMLSESVADELGLGRHRLNAEIFGAGGGSMRDGVSVKLQFDKLVSPNATFVLAPKNLFVSPDIVGIFGADYLINYDVEMDFKGKKFNLFSQDHCSGQVVYWAKSFIQIPFRLNDSHQIVMPVKLDGKELRAILDTGASTTLLGLPAAHEEFDLGPDSPGVEQQGIVTTADGAHLPAYAHRFQKLEIGGIAFGNPLLFLIPTKKMGGPAIGSRINLMQGEQPQLTLGMNELTKLHIYIAYGERMLYVTPAGAEP